jgi:hypothetical protein
MNTTTATQRSNLLAGQDIRLAFDFIRPNRPPPQPGPPAHDFLVLNQHPDLTPETFGAQPVTGAQLEI